MALILYKLPKADEYLAEIRQHGDPNYIDVYGIPALSSAIHKFSSMDLVRKLVNDGADVNRFTSIQDWIHYRTREWNERWGNFSPLHIAIAMGKADIVRFLLDNGADPKVQTSKGIEPLQILLDTNGRCLSEKQQVTKEEDLEILRLLVERGSNIHVRDKHLQTLLHHAIAEEKHQIARYLISVGCNVNCVDRHGATPLHYIDMNTECARVLLENNANPNAQDCAGRTVCHKIMGNFKTGKKNQVELLRLFHDYGINLNIPDDAGRTVLHACLEHVKSTIPMELIESVLQYGGDPNIHDELDRTPGFYLAGNATREREIFEIMLPILTKMLQHGMKLNKRDVMGQPLLHALVKCCSAHADTSYFRRMMECIDVDEEADVNIQDFHNRTALHLVSAEGKQEFVDILLKHGADLHAQDADGNTPLHVAVISKRWELAKNLLLLGSLNSNIRQFKTNKCFPMNASKRRWRSKSISGAMENKSKSVVPLGSRIRWTSKCLSAIEKYSDIYHNRFYYDILKPKKPARPVDSFACHSSDQDISKRYLNQVNATSLLQVCEENSVGDIHLTEKCEDEKCLIAKQVFRLVRDLVQKCGEIDPRLESNLLWTGSTAEGTKMWAPDEFDFMMELTKLKDRCNIEGGLYSPDVVVTKQVQLLWSNLLHGENCFKLSPTKIRNYMAALIWLAVLSLERSKYPNIWFNLCQYSTENEHFVVKTNVGVMLTLYWFGKKYKKLLINVDLTPAIPLRLSEKCKSELHKRAMKEWRGSNFHLIPYISLKHNYDDMWRVSFSLPELQLIHGMSVKEVNLYKCLKFLRDIQEVNLTAVPSYHLKTFIFDFVFGNEYSNDSSFRFNVHQALLLLHHRSEYKVHSYVKHFFLVHKRLSLLDFDMRWCSTALGFFWFNS